MSNTIRRDWLKRQILKGNVMVKCKGVYTDDYAFDAAYNYQKTDWMKAAIKPDWWKWLEGQGVSWQKYHTLAGNEKNELDRKYRAYLPDGYLLDERDFSGYGWAWGEKDGIMTLSFGYRSYDLKLISKNI